jgi:hypothetical protein
VNEARLLEENFQISALCCLDVPEKYWKHSSVLEKIMDYATAEPFLAIMIYEKEVIQKEMEEKRDGKR